MTQDRGKAAPLAASELILDGDEPEGVFSVGRYLKTQRVLRGISVEELSLRTRIPIRSIQRLEAGAFDGEPDGFVRGFVRSVAEGLGLDPHDTLVRMLREPNAGQRRRSLPVPARAWAALAAALLLVALVVGVAQFALSPAAALATTPGDEAVVRRDPVRALAEAQAASPSLLPIAFGESSGSSR